MISDRPPVRARPAIPTGSWASSAYTIAHRKKNTVQISKIRDSTLIVPLLLAVGPHRRRPLGALSVERIGGNGPRRAQLTTVERGQCLPRRIRHPGGRVVLGAQLQVPV